MIGLNVKPKTMKLLEENIERNLRDNGLHKDLLDQCKEHDPLTKTDKIKFHQNLEHLFF